MKTIRVLLAVEPRLLRDAFHAVLARHRRLIVIDEECHTIDILIGAREHRADVVIMTLEPTADVLPLVTHLLAEFPENLVVGIHLCEQRAGIYRNHEKVHMLSDVTMSGIIRAIFRGALKHGETNEH